MVTHALDHRDGARIAHGKALARDAAEIALAFNSTIKHGVADDDRLSPQRLAEFSGGRTMMHPPDKPLPT
jgi:hypothetical protein